VGMAKEAVLRFGRSILIAQIEGDGPHDATLYPALANIDSSSLPDAPAPILGAIPHLRIDAVNACNFDCIFCHSDFNGRARQLGIDDFAEVVFSGGFADLQQITMGCAYEPLMGKHIERYPGVMKDLRGKLVSNIVTNGALLHKRDISPWVEFGLQTLYVSVYSHIAPLYERTGRATANFSQIEENLLATRRRFPELRIVVVNPISKSNDVDIPGFCRWAFDYIGASAIDLRRAFFVENPSSGYPAYSYTVAATAEMGRSPALNDEEWHAILDSCSPYMTDAWKQVIRLGDAIKYDSVVLSSGNRQSPRSDGEFASSVVPLFDEAAASVGSFS